MCGRFTSREVTADDFQEILEEESDLEIPERFNVSPGQEHPVILKENEKVALRNLNWGLLPNWAKDPTKQTRPINSRVETLEEKPTFRESFQRRRCLVPADGYFEWLTDGRRKIPYFLHLQDDAPFAFAGLWDHWEGMGGEALDSYSIITTVADESIQFIHHRMPIILPRQHWLTWLTSATSAQDLREILKQPISDFQHRTVSNLVNNARNEGPELVKSTAHAIQGELF